MGIVRVTTPSEYGVVDVEGDRLSRIREKPRGVRLAEGWVNTGIYVLDEEVFRVIGTTGVSKRSEYELTSSLQRLVSEGKEIRSAIIAREDWMDVGRPWDLLDVNERVLASLPHRVKGVVEQGAVLRGPIWLEEEAVIKSGSYIEGPVYIGRGSKVGPNGRIRPFSSIGDGVVIGTSCEIKGSIVMNGTKIPHLSYVGDSVIGEDCNLGAGTITGNLRLDEETVRMRVKGRLLSTGRKKLGVIMGDKAQTAISVSLMPGVRVGSGAWVGPGMVLFDDVPSGRAVFAYQKTARKRLKLPKPTNKESTKGNG
jgi:bifunctional UDP-N-acetylglucosamine pyrophosphorylase/glucosamine-1-phosphate N-acetyltransferase